jgi:Protein of unknown function (DUF664)
MLRDWLDWLDWHPATLPRKCAGLDAAQLAKRAVPPSSLSLLGLVRHMSDTELGWVRQTYRGEQVPDTFMFREKTTPVRWMWQHLVEEYARHNGHADLLREAIDGSAGC